MYGNGVEIIKKKLLVRDKHAMHQYAVYKCPITDHLEFQCPDRDQ